MVGTDFAVLLAERLAGADARIAAAEFELDGVRRARGESVADDEHDPEGSTLTSDWSRIAAIVISAEAQRTAIQLAFARLQAGTFGRCLNCGGPIAKERLRARPEAELCIDCAR